MVVIADDLTGANDTAVQYRKYGVSSIVVVSLSGRYCRTRFNACGVISVNTDSRALPAKSAYDAVYKACRLFCKGTDCRVYKKTDSVLRGNPGVELEAVMDALDCRVAFVAPAYPENGRILRDGLLYAGDEKIRAVNIFSSEMKRTVCSVPLSVVQQGESALVQYVGNQRDSGTEVFIFDACTDRDLEIIYLAAGQYRERHVLCGSAGLARFDARRLAGNTEAVPLSVAPEELRRDGLIIAVTGSRNKETRSQFETASESLHVPCIVLDKKLIADHKTEQAIKKCLQEAEERILKGDKVLLLGVSSLFEEFHMVLKDSEENYRMAFDLAVSLGKLTERIYKKNPVRGIISNGGDTTLQLCMQLGVYGIEPVAEVVPGAPVGIMVGGRADGIPVITKSGGFGGDTALMDCINFFEH